MTKDQVTVHVMPTEYAVCALPEGNINAHSYEITVAYRGGGKWAVTRWRQCLGSDGTWEYEPVPSERDDEWLATHRFDLDTALRLAKEAAPKVTVNGHTIADCLAAALAKGATADPT